MSNDLLSPQAVAGRYGNCAVGRVDSARIGTPYEETSRPLLAKVVCAHIVARDSEVELTVGDAKLVAARSKYTIAGWPW